MSNKKKPIKKQKKGMSPEARRNLGLSFRSIISNQACVDGGKDAPWWIGLIFFVLAVILPLFPIASNTNKGYGSSFVANYNYGADRGLYQTSQMYVESNYVFESDQTLMHFYQVEGENKVELSHDDFTETLTVTKGEKTYDFKYLERDYEVALHLGTQIAFRFIVTNTRNSDGIAYFNDYFATTPLLKGSTDSVAPIDSEETARYIPSYMIITPDSIAVNLFGEDTTKSKASFIGFAQLDWTNFKGDLLEYVLEDCGPTFSQRENETRCFNRYKNVFGFAYTRAKKTLMRNTMLIFTGIYAGLILFLGLMIFLLTRGKNNMFHFLKFFTCIKIGWWTAFTPGLLGMLVGFMFGQNVIGQMGFIVMLSIRVMWLTMRQLRPIQ